MENGRCSKKGTTYWQNNRKIQMANVEGAVSEFYAQTSACLDVHDFIFSNYNLDVVNS